MIADRLEFDLVEQFGDRPVEVERVDSRSIDDEACIGRSHTGSVRQWFTMSYTRSTSAAAIGATIMLGAIAILFIT